MPKLTEHQKWLRSEFGTIKNYRKQLAISNMEARKDKIHMVKKGWMDESIFNLSLTWCRECNEYLSFAEEYVALDTGEMFCDECNKTDKQYQINKN